MNKYTLLPLIAAALVAGCTTKEQDEQIRTFWMMQSLEVMNKVATPANMEKLSKLAAKSANLGARETPHMDWPENFEGPTPAIPAQPAPQATAPVRRATPAPQFMDVTIDTDELPGKAPQEERAKMKRAFGAVQINNQATLASIENSFNASVKHKAFLITTQTEKDLKAAAAKSANFQAYFAEQKRLLALQDQKLTQLMKQNTANLKRVRRSSTR
ncbi:hypothetical protein [Candidatus Avelusimicrobium sp.]|uniref:hypothetical protein n=1 Tax=Candidatus Avelusimicrobium sp. TaxID=3048833 RepID=UPI003D7E2039